MSLLYYIYTVFIFRWFYHFYVVASLAVTAAIIQMGLLYIKGGALPTWEKSLFDVLTSPERKPAGE